ncbi:MAG: complex I NDUFA9 subunit family protein, partial [Asticcacaulis sp.]
FILARLIAMGGDLQALFGMAPILTTDQLLLLKRDNVVQAGSRGLKDLGIAPTAIESIVPTYLWRFRKNGQFAVQAHG